MAQVQVQGSKQISLEISRQGPMMDSATRQVGVLIRAQIHRDTNV